MIVVVSRGMADHLPRELAVLRGSKLLKNFVGRHLPSTASAWIPDLGRCEIRRAAHAVPTDLTRRVSVAAAE